MKPKTLFILHYSPPVHGAAKVGDTIVNNESIRNNFKTAFVKIESSNKIDDIGSFKIRKIFLLIQLLFKVCYQLIVFRPHKVYYTPSPSGFAFYRDIVSVSLIKFYVFVRRTVARSTGVYFHYHARGIRDFTAASKISRVLTEYLIKNTNIIFISDLMHKELEGLHYFKHVTTINNGSRSGITDNEFDSMVNDRCDAKTVNVLYLSNMIKEKGYDKVLELAKHQKEAGANKVHFHFAGSWGSHADQEFFFSFIKQHDLENLVSYHGFVSGDQKKELFKTSHLFVFPTSYNREIFPLSLLEALSYGLPILTYDTGAIKEVMTDQVGIISSNHKIYKDFEILKEKYLNTNTYVACRQRFLNNYTETIFVENLISELKRQGD